MSYLQYFLFVRFMELWHNRNLPYVRSLPHNSITIARPDASKQYLGPTGPQLAHMFLLGIVNSISLLGLSLLLIESCQGMLVNTTAIEAWEIERHIALVQRARRTGGYVYGPGGTKVWIRKQEYPFDIGIWNNVKQNMGSGNPLAWLWPFARTPSIEDAFEWQVNDFEGRFSSIRNGTNNAKDAPDPSSVWPPPDPERMSSAMPMHVAQPLVETPDYSDMKQLDAFRQRQAQDYLHKRTVYRSYPGETDELAEQKVSLGVNHSWKNAEGERLEDYGVDSEAERDADNVPLSQLLRSRNSFG